ncbi:rhodanese-like domain-containing protein [Prosthecobacter sp. SYSU 5D2]|uniref:rhodanese-like domain-containing protein n=1 Tax=Prosthecobacter sp. SYSU 5D2 TaxID=3134134 RepID=UPI0031FE4E3B
MKTHLIAAAFCSVLAVTMAEPPTIPVIPNRMISFSGFQENVLAVEGQRESHRLTEDQFLQMMQRPGVVMLDARSAAKFALRHIRGAVNLSLPDFNEADLAKVIPRKDTTVLIYCNNNFENSPVSFISKSFSTALNLHTLVSLQGYGYTHVYELGPLLDVNTTRLPFEGSEVQAKMKTPKIGN